jgi:hypothetical protein
MYFELTLDQSLCSPARTWRALASKLALLATPVIKRRKAVGLGTKTREM